MFPEGVGGHAHAKKRVNYKKLYLKSGLQLGYGQALQISQYILWLNILTVCVLIQCLHSAGDISMAEGNNVTNGLS